ncbi:MAG: nuclear transport factor 2 family protein [Gammaproteobacteria bacterium]|nr:nuclear transport factor 2 family protein [Gammaproteobacteria bacterium]
MDDSEALLAANAAFYAAFNTRDADAMAAIWATGEDVTCLHPGWPLLLGREAVLASWWRIFAAGASPTVTCLEPHARPDRDGGLVVCYELIGAQRLAASNLFRREGGELRLHHHHAGPCAEAPGEAPGTTRH